MSSMPATARPRLAVMISGGGRTLLNLLKHTRSGSLGAEIALVIASSECPGAEKARDAGLRTLVVPGRISAANLESLLREHRVDWVVLAGYLKLVSVPDSFAGRIVNIHPALLPRHGGPGLYGHRVHEAVLKAGDKVSGCTVHLCDQHYDTGPIILQREVPVLKGDTPETLASRVFEAECSAYPEALQRLLSGRGHG